MHPLTDAIEKYIELYIIEKQKEEYSDPDDKKKLKKKTAKDWLNYKRREWAVRQTLSVIRSFIVEHRTSACKTTVQGTGLSWYMCGSRHGICPKADCISIISSSLHVI